MRALILFAKKTSEGCVSCRNWTRGRGEDKVRCAGVEGERRITVGEEFIETAERRLGRDSKGESWEGSKG